MRHTPIGNTDSNQPMSWNHPNVHKYADTIALKIPGYAHLYEMTDCLITAQLEAQAHTRNIDPNVLIVGAGGGQELITLGGRHEAWSFTAVDPSEHMLDLARKRVTHAGISSKISFVAGTLEELSGEQPEEQHEKHGEESCREPVYDAATCLLVLHFLRSLESKQALLRQISARLKPGAPFCLASINGNPQEPSFSIQMQAWKGHMLSQGISLEDWERFAASIGRESNPVSNAAIQELLIEAGFTHITRYYGAFLVNAWFAVKEGETTYDKG
ncbi:MULTISPECIES: class I SAM-dependent methyltransferase [Paenibacillus]|uniref:SAM-dependent methyltransferase n=2 Tax=Paenibacillus TaxID=44249 RepID=A0ABX2ZB36_PAEPO|nr:MULTISPECIES: class I SAM-dependent methyltransferase [Paenibacillus]ALA41282.1 SAM-dependent methyltransferase [Paenibacillus peoriae]MDR6777771.1 tRNA (cmo5U34)-methyltransferase [Paenibacillus peoriae]ODA08641.1 SAM-dependent methyltransferase [Paenibacillus polymyxa]OME66000.1 SAM-dependent methyltransferase [Paenibacillus peoriae]OMF34007.1 SAM-dependent methyltransferase [Paenibacillus peoriae]